ncbi:glycosyltransferase family 25 protein [Psychrobacter sp. JCM 18900]|uniref:glycosyltransferase family 25 protein n=1 Tax=Psychrobacter sp. JCM 18900 TaxID=1298608 RepID=UPI0004352345|nr:glycosyltransferase family 25 protein [Psychrobacter sp. JCM 18900]GAF52290.1 lipooligosaccharide biosynthesis protein LpsA [Psychrobacter sp. JCM 18900]
MRKFVISLASATDRRKHIESEFGKHNVNYEFFDALTPDVAKPYAERLSLDLASASLTLGEIACMMSHVAIWEKIIKENLAYATIFEDDIYLGDDAEPLLNCDKWIKFDWQIVKIEAFAKKTYLSKDTHAVLGGKRYVTELKGKNLGTAGYILSLQGAKVYLDYIKNNNLLPLDSLMFDNFIISGSEAVQQLVPALCIQEMLLHKNNPSLPSALLTDRKDRMKLEKQKGFAKVHKEARRLVTQAKKALFAKEVPFK